MWEIEVYGAPPLATNAFQALLLHFDGTNGSTFFPDATGRHTVVTALGTVAIDTSKSVFGGASAKFSNNSQLAVQLNRQAFDFETGDFTIDGWFFQTTLGGSDLWQWDDANNNDPFAVVQTNGQLQWVTNAGTLLTSGAGAVSAGVQTHIAFTRASSILRGFINGISIGSAIDTNNYNLPLIDLIIGPFFDAVGSWVDEFRIIKGLAVWTANFTPPASPYLPGPTTLDPTATSANLTLSSGNLVATYTGGTAHIYSCSRSLVSLSSGKFFVEMTCNQGVGVADGNSGIGIVNSSFPITSNLYIGQDTNSFGFFGDGTFNYNNAVISSGNGTWSTGAIVDVAIDVPNKLFWARVNGGNWNGSSAADPAAGVGGFNFAVTGAFYVGVTQFDVSDQMTLNFGATPYSFAPPSGFGNL